MARLAPTLLVTLLLGAAACDAAPHAPSDPPRPAPPPAAAPAGVREANEAAARIDTLRRLKDLDGQPIGGQLAAAHLLVVNFWSPF